MQLSMKFNLPSLSSFMVNIENHFLLKKIKLYCPVPVFVRNYFACLLDIKHDPNLKSEAKWWMIHVDYCCFPSLSSCSWLAGFTIYFKFLAALLAVIW